MCECLSLYICIYFGACDFALWCVCNCLLLVVVHFCTFVVSTRWILRVGFVFPGWPENLCVPKGGTAILDGLRSFYVFELFLLLLLFSFVFLCVYCSI